MKKLLITLVITIIALSSIIGLVACDTGAVVTVGYTEYKPMNYLDENGILVGFDTELAKAVFEKLGYTVVFKEISWDNKYVELDSATIECIWNGFTSNSADSDGVQRSDKVDFSYNYMLNAQCVVVSSAAAATLNSVAAFAGKTGYSELGSAGATYAKTLFGDSATLKTATKQMDALLQVKANAAEFAVLDYQLANSIVGKGDFANLSIVSSLTSESEYYAIGFKKGSNLTAKVNKVLEEFAADGTIKTIAEKYGVSGSVITDFSSQKNA